MYMGRSYNLLEGNPLTDQIDPGFSHEIFDWQYTKRETTEDGRYLVPDKVGHRTVSSCTLSTSTEVHQGATSYQN